MTINRAAAHLLTSCTLFNRLHVWDLSAGDIFPVLTIEAGGLVDGDLTSLHIASSQIASRQPLSAVSNICLFVLG